MAQGCPLSRSIGRPAGGSSKFLREVHVLRQRDAPSVAERLPGRAAHAERGHRAQLARRLPGPGGPAGLRAARLALAPASVTRRVRCAAFMEALLTRYFPGVTAAELKCSRQTHSVPR